MALQQTFLDLLVHPVNKAPLTADNAQQALQGGPDTFRIIRNVPVLLPNQDDNRQEAFNYQEHYEQDAIAFDYFADWHPVHKEENRRLHQQILKMVPAAATTILDVGCGGAWLAKALIPRGKTVISMDISTTNPVRAMEEVPSDRHFGLVADVYSLPVKENSIDCIVASEIIEHVKDPQLFLACLFKVLKPGGTIIVTTPYNEIIQKSLCIHCNQLTPHNAHIHSFTRDKITALAPAAAVSLATRIFNSKVLVNLQIHLLMRSFPFWLWSAADKFFVSAFGKRAMRLMLVVKK